MKTTNRFLYVSEPFLFTGSHEEVELLVSTLSIYCSANYRRVEHSNSYIVHTPLQDIRIKKGDVLQIADGIIVKCHDIQEGKWRT